MGVTIFGGKEMKEIIESIIEEISSGLIFDTHTIIECLLQKNSDAYLNNYNHTSTELYHGYISQIITDLEKKKLVERIGDSWSLNIRDNFSKCACWKKR